MIDDLKLIIESITRLSQAFWTTGNKEISIKLDRYNRHLLLAHDNIEEEYNKINNERLEQAQEQSSLILKSALAGIKIAEEGQADDNS